MRNDFENSKKRFRRYKVFLLTPIRVKMGRMRRKREVLRYVPIVDQIGQSEAYDRHCDDSPHQFCLPVKNLPLNPKVK